MAYFFIFILGAVIGSFLNVCIYRIPRDESIVFPGSRCVSCKKPILWHDNIPLISYILLRGKCRACGSKISSRYFLVELISAVCFLILYVNFRMNYLFLSVYSVITFALIVVAFIDLDFQIIPDRISIVGMFLGILLSAAFPILHGGFTWQSGLMNSALGALIGGGTIYLTGVLGEIVFKKESMGGGDVKLMAMLGAFLGWKAALLIFFLAPFLGTPAGLYLKFVKKQDIIPYGPYLSLASFIVILWGNRILGLLFL
ncbi:MAG: prepilin peptidase [Candidatus Omnitrophota bacterium]